MRTLLLSAALIATPAAAQDSPFVGEYSLAEGPDVGGGLLIRSDGRFQYMLAAGALDERAEGRWEMRGETICLTTEPQPAQPEKSKGKPREIDGAVTPILLPSPTRLPLARSTFHIHFDHQTPLHAH